MIKCKKNQLTFRFDSFVKEKEEVHRLSQHCNQLYKITHLYQTKKEGFFDLPQVKVNIQCLVSNCKRSRDLKIPLIDSTVVQSYCQSSISLPFSMESYVSLMVVDGFGRRSCGSHDSPFVRRQLPLKPERGFCLSLWIVLFGEGTTCDRYDRFMKRFSVHCQQKGGKRERERNP